MKIIYIDLLFFINTGANYLILLATAKICDIAVSRLCIGLSAVLGGVYSIFAAVPAYGFLNSFPVKLAAGLMMLLPVFRRREGFFRIAVVFFAVSAAFGGALFALGSGGVHIGVKAVILTFLLSWAAVTLAFRRTGKATAGTVSLEITCFGKSVRCTALIDTGNTLKDPVTGRGAAIVSQEVILSLLPRSAAAAIKENPPAEAMLALAQAGYSGRFRLLPYSAVGVSSGMLLALRPDSVTVNGKVLPGMLAAVSPSPVSDGGAYSALVGADNAYLRRYAS